MNFKVIAEKRQSCRAYDTTRDVEDEKLASILEVARLSPSACNGQPYFISVCKGDAAKKVAKATQSMGMNKFASEAPVLLVISERPYVKTAALGAKIKNNDYRSIDIGILSAYITAEATANGLSTCIIGWLDADEIKAVCSLDGTPRLVISLGYAVEGDPIRPKERKTPEELFKSIE